MRRAQRACRHEGGVRAGRHVIPGDRRARCKRARIRGVDSSGMLCSARELLLGEDHAGIIELAADAPVGRPASAGDPRRGAGDRGRRDRRTAATASACSGSRASSRRPGSARSDPARFQSGSCDASMPALRDHARLSGGRGGGLPAVRRPGVPRRAQRTEPGLAAGAPERDRPAADLDAGRHHQSRDRGSRPAAARVRCRESSGAISACASPSPASSSRRSTAGPTRSSPA